MPLNTHSLCDEAAVAVSTVPKKSGTSSKPRVLAADNKTRKLAGQSSRTPATKSDALLKLLRASKSKNAPSPSLIVGRVFDDDGHRLTPMHAAKGSRRYRYYATTTEHKPILRLPAADLERTVLDAVAAWLGLFENVATIVCSAEQSIDAFEHPCRVVSLFQRHT